MLKTRFKKKTKPHSVTFFFLSTAPWTIKHAVPPRQRCQKGMTITAVPVALLLFSMGMWYIKEDKFDSIELQLLFLWCVLLCCLHHSVYISTFCTSCCKLQIDAGRLFFFSWSCGLQWLCSAVHDSHPSHDSSVYSFLYQRHTPPR